MYRKGSLTIEAAVIIPVYLLVIVVTIQLAIGLYCEIRDEQPDTTMQELWLVNDFYKYQTWKGVTHD